MRKYLYWYGAVLLMGLWAGCQPEEDILIRQNVESLVFSRDTVFFDTVFTQINLPVQRLWIKNPNKGAIEVDIALEETLPTPAFTLVINGIRTNALEKVRLLGQDSLLILVEARLDRLPNNDILLVERHIRFQTTAGTQRLPIHAWGRNAILLRDYRVRSDEVWNADQPYILLSSLIVDSLQHLSIEAGAEIYAYPDVFIFVAGMLEIKGSAEKPVLLTGIRQEELFKDAPGQWGGIVSAQGAGQSRIRHARIRNARWGFRAGTPDPDTIPDVIIQQTRIENMSDAGVLAFGSDVTLENTLINNCLNQTFAAFAGGNYVLDHVTLANFSFDFLRQNPSIAFTNFFESAGLSFQEPLSVRIRNSILWGSLDEEIFIFDAPGQSFSLQISHSLIRTQQMTFFEGNDNVLNQNPRFVAPFFYDYQPDSLSPARDAGWVIPTILQDILGRARDGRPDMGAFEYAP